MEALILDADTMGMMGILLTLDSSERSAVTRKIEERIAQIKAGVGKYPNLQEQLQSALKDNLRVREDFDRDGRPMIIERYATEAGCWLKIMDWPNDQLGQPWTVEQVIEELRTSDMQSFESPEAYIRFKREKAARVRLENERRATDAVLAAIDKIGTKRIQNFIEVERAMVTGDRITATGDMLKSMERMTAASKRHEALVYHGLERGKEVARKLGLNLIGVDDQGDPVLTDGKGELAPAKAINPGHHPKVNKRG